MDKPVLIFGGTSEGRKLAEIFNYNHIYCTICVATEYGRQLLPQSGYINVISRRLDYTEICSLLSCNKTGASAFSYVIDATHPYATQISQNVKAACDITDIKYLRLLRGSTDNLISRDNNIITFPDIKSAACYLNKTTGNILLTTGSKDLSAFCSEIDDKSRITARVLPVISSIKACNDAGLSAKQVIAMQGPFPKETNTAMIHHTNAAFLVTKESGDAGGFDCKIAAAIETGIQIILIKKPVDVNGCSFKEILEITGAGNLKIPQKILLAGAGMGNPGTLTREAEEAIKNAELIIGSERLLQSIPMPCTMTFAAYDPVIIHKYIKDNPQYMDIVILLSGDTGFYSGAKKLAGELNGYDLNIIPGISSLSYFAAKLKISWQDMKLVSLHGRTQNVIAAIKNNRNTFILLGSKSSIPALADSCIKYGMDNLVFHIGYDFGYDAENIITGKPADFTGYIDDGILYAAIVENPDAEKQTATYGIPDNLFLRGNVPMTKEEIREISISKLRLTKDSVIYDIGAGTGSVSVECALIAYNGKTYAIEKNRDALELIEQNKKLHGADNLEIISGAAPDVMEMLEPPTHVFIGGSSGRLRQIVHAVFSKNSHARIVINAITLETLAEAEQIIKETSQHTADISYVSVSRSETIGNYHMMKPLNPIWIITIT